MITDAVQLLISPFVSSFSPIIESDELPAGVFAIHQEDIRNTLRDKDGIYGYEYNVQITVIGDSQDDIDPVTGLIIDLFEPLSGTYSETIIEEVNTSRSQGVTWDNEKKKYYDQITFSIATKNK